GYEQSRLHILRKAHLHGRVLGIVEMPSAEKCPTIDLCAFQNHNPRSSEFSTTVIPRRVTETEVAVNNNIVAVYLRGVTAAQVDQWHLCRLKNHRLGN